MTIEGNEGNDASDPALVVISDRQLRGQRCDSPDPSKGAGAWCHRSEGAVGSPDAPQHSAPAPSSLFPPCRVVPAPEANEVCDLSARAFDKEMPISAVVPRRMDLLVFT